MHPYLLFLQSIRNPSPEWFVTFMNKFSAFVIDVWPLLIIAFIYWAVSKKAGDMFFFNYCGGDLVNSIVKLTFCVYRPWITDAELIPNPTAQAHAGGYSFPSGHTTLATAVFGTAAWQERKRRRWVSVIMLICILVTMFSRNFLGVHTFQDVLVGFVETALVIALSVAVLQWVEKGNNRDIIMVVVGLALIALSIVFIKVKAYPMDYDAEGNLLVDPAKMTPDAYKAAGRFTAFFIGWLVERRFIRFERIKNLAANIGVNAVGLVALYYCYNNFRKLIPGSLGTSAVRFLGSTGPILLVFIVWPLVIKLVNKIEARGKAASDS